MNIFHDKFKLNYVISSFHISLKWCMHLKSLAFRYFFVNMSHCDRHQFSQSELKIHTSYGWPRIFQLMWHKINKDIWFPKFNKVIFPHFCNLSTEGLQCHCFKILWYPPFCKSTYLSIFVHAQRHLATISKQIQN